MSTEEDAASQIASAQDALHKGEAGFFLLIGSVSAFIFAINKFAHTSDSVAFFHSDWLAAFGAVFLARGIWHWPRWRKFLGITWLCLAALAAVMSSQYELLGKLPDMPGYHNQPEVVSRIGRACIPAALLAAAVGVSLIAWQRHLDRREW